MSESASAPVYCPKCHKPGVCQHYGDICKGEQIWDRYVFTCQTETCQYTQVADVYGGNSHGTAIDSEWSTTCPFHHPESIPTQEIHFFVPKEGFDPRA